MHYKYIKYIHKYRYIVKIRIVRANLGAQGRGGEAHF